MSGKHRIIGIDGATAPDTETLGIDIVDRINIEERRPVWEDFRDIIVTEGHISLFLAYDALSPEGL
jgi:hypothetical protein